MSGLRRLASALIVALVAWLSVGSLPATAASSVTYDRFDVNYTVDAEGVVRVQETIVVRFGPSSGRHGYDRILVTREPFDADRDAVFKLSNVKVTTPDRNVSTAFKVTEQSAAGGRNVATRIRIGDADRTITAPTATYVLSYDVKGFLRSPENSDVAEFYLDALGPDLGTIRSSTITVTVPGGAKKAACWAGPVKGTTPCTAFEIAGGVATFRQAPLTEGEILSVDVGIDKQAVKNATPQLVESATAAADRGARLGQIGGGIGAALAAIGGFFYYRGRLRDDRFAGLPPGTFPPPGDRGNIVTDPGLEVPVAFSPPKLPLMYAGFLWEGRSDVRHLTATLVGLATAGAIRLSSPSQGERPLAFPIDPGRIPDRPSKWLYEALFDGSDRAAPLDERGDLVTARDRLFKDAESNAERATWFKRRSLGVMAGGGLSMIFVIPFVLFIFGQGTFSAAVLWALIPTVIALLIVVAIGRRVTARGQRTAVGRAYTDQIEGFRTYLATAEADQLRFEEGEDIFSRYLPWAILFGLAQRWAELCERAVQLGLMAQPDTGWYGGGPWDPRIIIWNVDHWDQDVSTSVVPEAPQVSFDNTGFGGGSGFGDGGGFSGGGFGGGGGDSW